MKILATDIDTEMIAACRRGVYRVADALSVPPPLRAKFLEPVPGDRELRQTGAALRSLITFNPLNLNGPWPLRGKFDIVFCRNVIIYFDQPVQAALFDRFAGQMQDGGYLYIGHSESLHKVTGRFRPVGQSVYQKVR